MRADSNGRRHLAAALAAAAAGLSVADASAATFTWDGGGADTNWNTANNWNPNGAPTSSDTNDLVFTGSTGPSNSNNITNPFILNTITFDSAAGAFTIGGSQLQFAGASSAITQSDNSIQLLSAAIDFNKATTLGGNGTGAVTLSGLLSGSAALTKLGTSNFLFTNANTYNGAFSATAGSVTLSGSNGSLALAASYRLNGGTLALDNSGANKNSRLNSSANVTLSGGNLSIAGATASSTNTTEAINQLALDTGFSTLTVSSGSSSNKVTLTAGSFVRSNNATGLINGTNLGVTSSSPQARLILTSQTGLTLIGTTAASGGPGSTTNLKIVPYLIGDTGTGTGNSFVTYDSTTGLRPLVTNEFVTDFSSGSVGRNVRIASSTDTSGSTDRAFNSLIIATTSTVRIDHTITITSGALLFSSSNTITNTANNGAMVFGTQEAVISAVSGVTATINPSTGHISGSGGFTKAGAGTLVLNSSSDLTGAAIVNAGTLRIASADTLSTTDSLTVAAAGTFDLNGVNQTVSTLNGSGTIGNSSTSTNSVFTSSFATGAATFDGVIQNTLGSGNKTVALVKSGAGALTLTGANTYSGGTTISGGTLRINNASGSGTGTGTVTVSAGTLGGSGTIATSSNAGVTIASTGKLSPGAAASTAGTLTLNLGSGSLNLSAAVNASNTQSLQFDLNGAPGAGTSDQVALGASTVLTIGSGVLEFNDFAFTAGNGIAIGSYTLFDSSTAISGTLGTTLSGSINSFVTGTIAFADGNHDIVLNVTAAPEPSSMGLMAVGVAGLLVRRRRK